VFEVPGTLTVAAASQFTVVGGSTLGLTGQNLVVASNSVIWCEGKNRSAKVNGQWAGVGVTIEAANITVDATSKISADGLGYQGICGPGAGGYAAGGSYGGRGGNSPSAPSATYGSSTEPADLGSGGGWFYGVLGGSGGGAIEIVASNLLHLDGGVTANGETPAYGTGGSGGSVHVMAERLEGAGRFEAKGGNGTVNFESAGGGGGRVAVYYSANGYAGIGDCSVQGGRGPGAAGQPGTLAFFDTSVWGNHLHVYSRFVFEHGDAERPALITVEAGGELVLANGETWSLIDRLTINPSATFAVESGSHLTTAGLSRLENLNLAIRNGGVLEVVGNVVLGTGAHLVVATGSAAQVSGLLHVGADGVLDFQPGSALSVTGGMLLEGAANLAFGGDVFFGETGYLNMAAGTRCSIKGNLTGSTKNSFNFAPSGIITFNGTGTLTSPQLLEVMSADRGTGAPNFTRNFAFGGIEVSNGTRVKLVNQYANVAGAASEALYAQSLVVAAGATLDLAGFNVYVRQVQLAGTVVNGTVTQIPDSGPVVRNTGTPGTISLPGELDEWTFYGRTGETLAVAVNPGPSGAFAPVAPQIGQAEVLVIAPDGQVVASAASSAVNQIVSITGLTLPATGQYRVRIHAPAAQSAAVGNYTVAVWDAITRQFPVALNQQQAGTLPTPYSEDRWTFGASANQQIRFKRLNSSAGTLKFDLLGPVGWTGFTDVLSQSDLVTLPSSGTYTLVARGTGGTGSVSYSFQIEETTVIDLPPGSSYDGQFAGSGQAMLFKIHLDHSSPLRVSVGARLPVWAGVRFYLGYGHPPTLRSYDQFRSLSHAGIYYYRPIGSHEPPQPPPTDKAEVFIVPMAAAGDWYLLADPGSAVSFTVSAKAGDVLVESISSSLLSGNVGMDLIIKGCGFKSPAQVTLVGLGGAEYAAAEVAVISSYQVTATFPANSLPAGTYSVRVATGAASQDTLSGALHVISNGTPELKTILSTPGSVGYHQLANITVEYGNTGNAAMPAPLLVLTAFQKGQQRALMTLDSSIVGQGLWTSAIPKGFSHSVQILGGGNTPGLLQPGEWQSLKAYYAGWQLPYDFSYPPIQFVLGTLTEDNTAAIDWTSMKGEMRPPRLSDEAWDALWASYTAGVGSDWGDYVAMLNNNARYLGRLGLNVRDISELLRFEFLQASGLSPLKNLASSQDAAVDVPGVSLGFVRSYLQSITDRHTLGAFGYGWTHSWDVRLETAGDGTITILGPGSAQRTFQPDVRGGWFANKGDYGTLRATGAGSYTLQEKSGLLTAFRPDGKLDYVADPNGNRVTAAYTGSLLTRLTHSAGPWLQIDHNASGLISRITDSVGRITGYTYDAAGLHLLSVQAPDTRVVSYHYLPAGNVTSGHALTEIAYPGGTHRYFTYDAAGRLGSIARDGDKEHVSFAYDTAGRVTATNAVGGSTRFYFDHLGRLAKTEDPLGRAVGYGRDIQQNLTSLIGPEGHTYAYGYDWHGNLTKMTDPLRGVTEFSYTDPYNSSKPFTRLNLLTDANDHATRHESDVAGNLAGIVMTDGS
jgi:YD repeat-containing protein